MKHAGVHTSLEELNALQYEARGLSFLPRQPLHSLLSGRHASRMRGRGLNFEEIRRYLPGDDIRSIDWKVTARTRKPHTRVFTEERDRPVLLVVDQRASMFFGTRVAMKSVTAAEAAAVAAWRALTAGDRVGAIVFDDTDLIEIRPHRSRAHVLRILHAIVGKNQALGTVGAGPARPAVGMLNRVLARVVHVARHDHLVVVLSDFDGVDDETRRHVTVLAQRNDVIAAPIYDPIATDLPERGRLVVSDGDLQVELDVGSKTVRTRMKELADSRLGTVMGWQEELGLAVLPLTTDVSPVTQLRTLLGARVRARRG